MSDAGTSGGGTGGGRPDGPRRVGDLVRAFLDDKGLESEVASQKVLADWPAIVGEPIAEVTRARSVSKGTLFVEVRSSAWLMELTTMKRRLLELLNEGAPPDRRIERIVFIQGGLSDEEPLGP